MGKIHEVSNMTQSIGIEVMIFVLILKFPLITREDFMSRQTLLVIYFSNFINEYF